jgi:hypothetical protein
MEAPDLGGFNPDAKLVNFASGDKMLSGSQSRLER